MQSQLCKAMHCMGALQHQLEILNAYSGQVLSALRGSMAQITEEKTMVEVKLMNDLMQVDTLKRRMEDGLRRSLEEFQASQRVFSLSQSFTTQESGGGNTNDNDDDSAEIDEDLLLEILQERKEDIAAMEQENAKQEEQIKELKAKIEAAALSTENLTNGNHQ
jgi:multidrug resistance efflux pump